MSGPFLSGRLAVLALALFAMTVLAAYQAWQNRQLLGRYYELGERAALPVPGTALPSYQAETLGGDSLILLSGAGGTQQLLFYFTTTCRYCEASLPAWERIHRELADDPLNRTAVIGIGIDDEQALRDYAARHGLTFPVVSLSDSRQRQLYRTRRVPYAVLVDSTGFVKYSRRGQLDGTAIDSVLNATGRVPSGRSRTAATNR